MRFNRRTVPMMARTNTRWFCIPCYTLKASPVASVAGSGAALSGAAPAFPTHRYTEHGLACSVYQSTGLVIVPTASTSVGGSWQARSEPSRIESSDVATFSNCLFANRPGRETGANTMTVRPKSDRTVVIEHPDVRRPIREWRHQLACHFIKRVGSFVNRKVWESVF